MYKISVITEDDFEVTFECPPSEDIISAGVGSDVILLSSCHEGGCATCKAECLEGEYELGRCSVQALPPDEEEASKVLLCRTYPRSDLVIRVPYTFERISFQKANTDWQGEIVAVEKIASNVAKLQIEPKDLETGMAVQIPFLAGQYLDIEIPGTGTSRCYSMATIDDDPSLDFLIRILPDGRFSQFLSSEAVPGVVMKLRGPFGGFNIRENGLRARYFVAGGTGLAPVLSMIRYMKREQHPQEAKLFFGVTHQHEVFYLAELKKLEAEMPNLKVYVTVMKPDSDWQGCTGTVVDELIKQLRDAKVKPDIYLCGPPAMIDATFAAAATCGVPKEQVYVEKFLASGAAVAAE
ncbi:aromatic/alkene monooxygenase hydroxylase FAD-binding subunit MmoC [Methylovirgula sp. HY1]|uniref:aromatic/alkene monooxygenase hydroxylase FAD-binding subunit MmoC n=1 Tax=Methylovirgula sp. HY1 TaxID=2822761 RepID=UPI001C5ABF5E|nr:2Fe-2S iron-sulfur cluster binding domain-containing protein [Methylovirgula sp. HY1]QXX76072.1 Methane monooxygenase component C [Methylovirgula sp. HY1]